MPEDHSLRRAAAADTAPALGCARLRSAHPILVVLGLVGLAASLSASSAAAQTTVYSYSKPFDLAIGTCATDPVLDVEVEFAAPIPPNTPLPSVGNDTAGVTAYSFSACGETCSSDSLPCGLGGFGTTFRFGTDGSGDVESWEVNIGYQVPPGESLSMSTTRRPLEGIEGDLFQSPDGEAASLVPAAWSISAGETPVPSMGGGGRFWIGAVLLAFGTLTLAMARRRGSAQRAR